MTLLLFICFAHTSTVAQVYIMPQLGYGMSWDPQFDAIFQLDHELLKNYHEQLYGSPIIGVVAGKKISKNLDLQLNFTYTHRGTYFDINNRWAAKKGIIEYKSFNMGMQGQYYVSENFSLLMGLNYSLSNTSKAVSWYSPPCWPIYPEFYNCPFTSPPHFHPLEKNWSAFGTSVGASYDIGNIIISTTLNLETGNSSKYIPALASFYIMTGYRFEL